MGAYARTARETKSQAPLLLYTFIAEHIDADGGVLVADQETICEAIGVSRTTLWRAITFLEERNALLRIVVGGSVSAYALDPTEIWRSWDSARKKGPCSRHGRWFESRLKARSSGVSA